MRRETGFGVEEDRAGWPDPQDLDCLLTSYEQYGVSHVWPDCLGRPATAERGT